MPGCSKIYLDVACLQLLPCQKEPRCKRVGKWKAEDRDPGTKMEASPSLCFHKCKHLFRVPEPSTAEQRTQQPKESSILDMKNKDLHPASRCWWLPLARPSVSVSAQTQVSQFRAKSISLQTPRALLPSLLLHSHSPCSSETMTALAKAEQGQQSAGAAPWVGDDGTEGESKELSRLQIAQELNFCLARWFSSHPLASVQFVLDSGNCYQY